MKEEYKYRILVKTRNDGSKEYNVQFKWGLCWITMKNKYFRTPMVFRTEKAARKYIKSLRDYELVGASYLKG